ncbi:MAG: hypothetical protein WEB50_08730 [Vicinamibacterales bacterium]
MSDGILLKDREWASIDGQLCLVRQFVPMAKMENGQVTAISATMPYASVTLSTEDGRELKGFIGHKTDFAMMWVAFNERTEVAGTRLDVRSDIDSSDDLCLEHLGENEEVWLIWTRKSYRTGAGFFKSFLPRLIVMVSRKGALELLRNRDLRPELSGEARHCAISPTISPLLTWTPEVMKL